jgi:four helix bundle protein
MAKYKDLVVWQKADELALTVYRLTETFPEKERYGTTGQLRRAALSVPTNIVEGYGRKSKKDFARFLDNARGSLAETEYLLSFSAALGYIRHDLTGVYALMEEVGKLLRSFQKHL